NLTYMLILFFFRAEDGIRDFHVTGVQTCALPIFVIDAVERHAEFQTGHERGRVIPADGEDRGPFRLQLLEAEAGHQDEALPGCSSVERRVVRVRILRPSRNTSTILPEGKVSIESS